MKRGTPDHPKVYELAERLGVSWPTAIGHLELLFHFTAQYCPQGNIGKYSAKRIASALGWHKRPEVLLEGMVKSGWVDPDPIHTLIVHDWHLHCDRTTAQRVSRLGLSLVQPNHKDAAKVCTQSETNNCTLPEPEPTTKPEPKPEPQIARDLTQEEWNGFDASAIAREIWARHPNHRKGSLRDAERALGQRLMSAVNPERLAITINQNHIGWCNSRQWRDGRITGLTRWLTNDDAGCCMTDPPTEQKGEYD